MTCDKCWEEPCTCREFLKVSAPSYKLLSDEEAAKQAERLESPEVQKMLLKWSLRNFRDAGMVTRKEFEDRMEKIERTGEW